MKRFNLNVDCYRTIKGKPYQTLYCLKGTVWITQERDTRDYILQEEDAFMVTQTGHVVIMALHTAIIGFSEAGLTFESSKNYCSTVALK